MFPFERFMAVLKGYVRNRSRPEGCIAEGYGTEEVIEFYLDYMDFDPIGIPVSRHQGRVRGKGTLGAKAVLCEDRDEFRKAHFCVLSQPQYVDPFLVKHKQLLREEFPTRSEGWLQKWHAETFGNWLRLEIMRNLVENPQLRWLVAGPSTTIMTYQGYEINGFTFYTVSQDAKSTNQNSGACVQAFDSEGTRQLYYGTIENIWELDYGP